MNKIIAIGQYNLKHSIDYIKGNFAKLIKIDNDQRLTRVRMVHGKEQHNANSFEDILDFKSMEESCNFSLEFEYE